MVICQKKAKKQHSNNVNFLKNLSLSVQIKGYLVITYINISQVSFK